MQALSDIPIPSTPENMQNIVRSVNFFRRFFNQFASAAKPFYETTPITPPNQKVQWNQKFLQPSKKLNQS